MPQNKEEYYLVEAAVLPEVFHKIIQAKNLLASGQAKTVHEASTIAGISRSTFYKYKDSVFLFREKSREKIITFLISVLDVKGILSKIMRVLSQKGADVLTINQDIPMDGVANITISFRTGNLTCDVVRLKERLLKIEGVKKIEIIASQ